MFICLLNSDLYMRVFCLFLFRCFDFYMLFEASFFLCKGGFIEMQNLTQQEFIQRIDMLKRTLTHAWNENQKVKALKIAIQVHFLSANMYLLSCIKAKRFFHLTLFCLVFEAAGQRCCDSFLSKQICISYRVTEHVR